MLFYLVCLLFNANSTGKHVREIPLIYIYRIYIVKLGCAGVNMYLVFYFYPKHRLWVLAEAVLACSHNQCFEQNYYKSNIKYFPI